MHLGPIEYDGKMSLGNIITIVMAAIAFIYGYGMLSGDAQFVKERVARLEGRTDGIESLVRSEQLTNSRILTQLQTDMSYVKTSLDELKASQP